MVDGYFFRKELNYTINELETKEEAQEEPKEEQKN